MHSAILMESMVVSFGTLWERLVENDMVLLFAQNTEKYCQEYGYQLPETITRDESEAILVGEKYLGLGYSDRIKHFAKKHLVDNLNPFKKERICASSWNSIDDLIRVRNHVAHRSSMSARSYRELLMTKYRCEEDIGVSNLLLSTQSKPGIFTPFNREKKFYELYIDALKNASQSIVRYLRSVI